MNFLRKVPGFRSGNKRNKNIAGVFYGFMLLSIVAVFPEINLLAMVLSVAISPFAIFGVIDLFKKKKDYGNQKKVTIIYALVSFALFVVSMITTPTVEVENGTTTEITVESTVNNELNAPTDVDSGVVVESFSTAEIHFINTGNSDAILITQDGESMLIDAADNDDEERVVSYLKNKGVTKLKYVISTHPDADHCGGLDAVVDNLEVEQVFVANGSADTKTYKDFITSLSNKGLSPSVPLLGSTHTLGTSSFEVVSVANKNDVNNNSIVILYTNGNDKMLFMGDAGKEIENTIDVGDVDLIKIGHHGSNTSTSSSFIDKVSPEFAVALVGENNKYAHPHEEVMSVLKDRNIPLYRTDELGDIIFKSSGNGISTDSKPGSYSVGKKESSVNSTSTSTSSNGSTSSGTTSSSNSNSNSSTSSSNSNSSSSNNNYKPNNNNNASSNSSSSSSGSSNNASSNSSSSSSGGSSSSTQGSVSVGETVYWTSSGKKYHFSSTCSNMKNPISGTVSESGRTPCSKCAY